MAKNKSVFESLAEVKKQNDNAIMFIAGETTFQAFFDDAMIVNLGCGFHILRDIIDGQLISHVSVPFSKLEPKIPVLLVAGYKVVVYGEKMKKIYQK